MSNDANQGRPSFPLTGTLTIENQSSHLACPDGTVYTLWRSSPPTADPDAQAAQRASTYLQDGLNKITGDPLTVNGGKWPFAAPSNVLCIISGE
jgi:hypothetical protein